MKTLKELKQAAENKGLRHEVNKWDPTIHRWETDKEPNPDFMKIEIGIEYRPNIWAWFEGYVQQHHQHVQFRLHKVSASLRDRNQMSLLRRSSETAMSSATA